MSASCAPINTERDALFKHAIVTLRQADYACAPMSTAPAAASRHRIFGASLLAAWLVTVPAFAADWQASAPADTTCWDGSPWQFYYRSGRSDRVAIWFGSADACWSTPLCDASTRAPIALEPPQSAGLLDAGRSANPLEGYSQAWLPDCTLDMQTGDRTVDYPRQQGRPLRVAHVGQLNVTAALDALQQRVATPRIVFVGGDGSGAIAAAFWATQIGNRWPDAELIVLGAGAGGYRSRTANAALSQWGALAALPDLPAYQDRRKIYFESFYIATAQRHRRARLGEVNFANDAVQRRFMTALGTPVAQLSKPLQCNMNEVRINAAGFHSFMVPGTEHAILRTDAVYAMHCEAQSLIDWIADLVAGRPLETHWCDGELTLHTNRAAPLL
jgi:hypothetical protein